MCLLIRCVALNLSLIVYLSVHFSSYKLVDVHKINVETLIACVRVEVFVCLCVCLGVLQCSIP